MSICGYENFLLYAIVINIPKMTATDIDSHIVVDEMKTQWILQSRF